MLLKRRYKTPDLYIWIQLYKIQRKIKYKSTLRLISISSFESCEKYT